MSQRCLTGRGDLGHQWHADRQNRPRAVSAVAGDDPAAERLDKAAADRKAQTGAGAAPVLSLDPVKFVEDALEIGGRYPWALVDNLDLDKLPIPLRAEVDPTADGGVFRGVVKKVEQDLLEQHRIEVQHREPRLDLDIDPMPCEHAACPL